MEQRDNRAIYTIWIAIAGLILSLCISLLSVGQYTGRIEQRVDTLEKQRDELCLEMRYMRDEIKKEIQELRKELHDAKH